MVIKDISSPKNHGFRMFMKLLIGQGVRKYGLALISGPKQVREVLRDFTDRCEGLVLEQDHMAALEALPDRLPVYRLSSKLFRQVDAHGTGQPLALVRIAPFSPWKPGDRIPGCTLFVPFQDPANVGAVIRSAAAFGVARVVLLQEAAHPFHHKSTRVAGSTVLRVPLLEGPSIAGLTSPAFPIVSLSAKGSDIRRYKFPRVFGLLPGLEGPGLPSEVSSFTALSIPMEPGVESLNAALATGIALYVWRSKMREV